MSKLIIFTASVLLAIALFYSLNVNADPDYSTAGAVLGATAGLIIGNNSSHIDQELAVPLMAAVGALIGREIEQKRDEGIAAYYKSGQTRPSSLREQTESLPNKHPGIDLIKVSIINSNGITTDIPIIRMKDKYIGPQGETYDTLPTAEELTKKYGM